MAPVSVGSAIWTRRLVENTLAVRGWEIRFHHGPSIALVRFDMKDAEKLVAAVEHALAQR